MGLFSSLKKKLSKTVLGKALNKSHLVKTVNKTVGGKLVNKSLGLDEGRTPEYSGYGGGMGAFRPRSADDFAALAGGAPEAQPGGAEPAADGIENAAVTDALDAVASSFVAPPPSAQKLKRQEAWGAYKDAGKQGDWRQFRDGFGKPPVAAPAQEAPTEMQPPSGPPMMQFQAQPTMMGSVARAQMYRGGNTRPDATDVVAKAVPKKKKKVQPVAKAAY